mgnify:CR=1 FL=1
MTHSENRPEVSLLRTLFLWGARWTLALGLIGIATRGNADVSWVWTVCVVVALGDLFLTLLKEARLAEKRAKSRALVTQLKSRLDEKETSGET